MTAEQQNFINTIGKAALLHYPKYKVLPSLTIAQIIKESGWGKSGLARDCFNYTGMKWTSTCGYNYKEYNTKEWDGTKYITIRAKFIKFDTPADGIEGHYKFIHKYKRYASIIGETDAQEACKKMGKSGWATAPDYGTSLWKDYVKKYDLVAWDKLALSGASVVEQPIVESEPAKYVVGNDYVLGSDLYVRDKAAGGKLKFDALTQDAKLHAKYDEFGNAILLKGTKVTCKSIVELKSSTWIKIPSGWICAISGEKVYIDG